MYCGRLSDPSESNIAIPWKIEKGMTLSFVIDLFLTFFCRCYFCEKVTNFCVFLRKMERLELTNKTSEHKWCRNERQDDKKEDDYVLELKCHHTSVEFFDSIGSQIGIREEKENSPFLRFTKTMIQREIIIEELDSCAKW